jgi:hypothetical protein
LLFAQPKIINFLETLKFVRDLLGLRKEFKAAYGPFGVWRVTPLCGKLWRNIIIDIEYYFKFINIMLM